VEQLTRLVQSVPDFPTPGVVFRDITPLLADRAALRLAVEVMARGAEGIRIDQVVAIESRGFILGAALAYALGTGFVPVRKPGKLPRTTVSRTYALEYGTNDLEVHFDAIHPGERVLLVDDVLATGGTAAAAIELVREIGGEVIAASFLIELKRLEGRSRLPHLPINAVLTF
jgi:adenine phosphoribosyltransferase